MLELTKIKGKDKISKATRGKWQITYKGTPIRLSADFSTETVQARREWHHISKVMKGKNLQSRTLYPVRLIHIWWRNQNLPRQAKVKKIQHHQTSFTINCKRTSLGRKHKRSKRPTENKPKTMKKMIIRSYIPLIILNVNGLNAPTERHRLARRMKICACMHFRLPYYCAWPPQIACSYFGVDLVGKSCLSLVSSWTVACQPPLPMGFPR